jgi:hypothetical protein
MGRQAQQKSTRTGGKGDRESRRDEQAVPAPSREASTGGGRESVKTKPKKYVPL